MVYFALAAKKSVQAAVYSTQSVRFQSTSSVASFLSRIDALRDVGVKKGGTISHDFKLEAKPKNGPNRSNNSRNNNNSNNGNRNNRNASGGENAQGKRASGQSNNGNRPNNGQRSGQKFGQRSGQRPGYRNERGDNNATPKMNINVNLDVNFKKADPKTARFQGFDASEAHTIISGTSEKSDLHVSSKGGVLFKRRSNFSGPRQGGNNNANKSRFGKPRFAGAKGGRKNDVRVRVKAASAEKTELSPEEALVSLKESIRDSAIGRNISVDDVSVSSLAPYIPGTCATTHSRAWNAIQRASEEASAVASDEKKALISDIVNSTFKGSLNGYALSSKDQKLTPILNSNPTFSLEAKNLIFNLASGKTDLSSLRK